jgi:hypothetical protein
MNLFQRIMYEAEVKSLSIPRLDSILFYKFWGLRRIMASILNLVDPRDNDYFCIMFLDLCRKLKDSYTT